MCKCINIALATKHFKKFKTNMIFMLQIFLHFPPVYPIPYARNLSMKCCFNAKSIFKVRRSRMQTLLGETVYPHVRRSRLIWMLTLRILEKHKK